MKKSLFKKSLIIYSVVLVVLMLAFLFYIYFTLVTYENSQTGVFLRSAINKISDDELVTFLKDNNQDEKLLADYKELIKSKDLEFKKEKDNVYTVSLNNRLLFTVDTKVTAEKTKLGLFTYQEKEVVSIKPNLERGLIYYDVIVPSNFEIYLDGQKQDIKPKEGKNYEGLDFMYYENLMPNLATFEINNLPNEKEVTVKDFLGNNVELKKDKNVYTTDKKYIEAQQIEDAKKYLPDMIDVIEVAHNWSLFLTRDLKGAYYGLNTITSYLIQGTSLYQMAYNWAHSVDITFTSKHTLTNPIFTNEKLNNFKIYSDTAFSCEIYTEKGMIVKNQVQQDVMHDYLYFVKKDGNWKLINIKAIEDKNE